MPTISSELRALLPTWAVIVLLPVPMSTFWLEGSGRDFAYGYLFLGRCILAGERFAHWTAADCWRTTMTALAIAMTGAAGVLVLFAWSMTGDLDLFVPLFALLAVVPAFCCVPYLTAVTGNTYTATLFAVLLMVGIKLAGCVVCVFVYGWAAQETGKLTLPWHQPNLLVWSCLTGAAICSAVMCLLGRRTFMREVEPALA